MGRSPLVYNFPDKNTFWGVVGKFGGGVGGRFGGIFAGIWDFGGRFLERKKPRINQKNPIQTYETNLKLLKLKFF